jgi:hypothetical protein
MLTTSCNSDSRRLQSVTAVSLDLADSPPKIVIHVIGFSGSNSKVVSAKYYFLDPPLDGGGIASIYWEGSPVGYVRRYDTVLMPVAEGVSLDLEACAHNNYNKRMTANHGNLSVSVVNLDRLHAHGIAHMAGSTLFRMRKALPTTSGETRSTFGISRSIYAGEV